MPSQLTGSRGLRVKVVWVWGRGGHLPLAHTTLCKMMDGTKSMGLLSSVHLHRVTSVVLPWRGAGPVLPRENILSVNVTFIKCVRKFLFEFKLLNLNSYDLVRLICIGRTKSVKANNFI